MEVGLSTDGKYFRQVELVKIVWSKDKMHKTDSLEGQVFKIKCYENDKNQKIFELECIIFINLKINLIAFFYLKTNLIVPSKMFTFISVLVDEPESLKLIFQTKVEFILLIFKEQDGEVFKNLKINEV
jgi:hypothetical protein